MRRSPDIRIRPRSPAASTIGSTAWLSARVVSTSSAASRARCHPHGLREQAAADPLAAPGRVDREREHAGVGLVQRRPDRGRADAVPPTTAVTPAPSTTNSGSAPVAGGEVAEAAARASTSSTRPARAAARACSVAVKGAVRRTCTSTEATVTSSTSSSWCPLDGSASASKSRASTSGKLAGAASTAGRRPARTRVGWSVSAASVQGTTLTVCPLERSTRAAESSAFQPEGGRGRARR